MKIRSRYLSLLLSFVLLFLPAGAEPDTVPGYNNTTVEPGWNETQNASYYYFDSDSIPGCVAAGTVDGYGEVISAEGLVEEIVFLTDSPEAELSPVWTPDGNYIMYTVRNESGNFYSYQMRANGSEIEQTDIVERNFTGFSDINLNGTELLLTKSIDSQSGLYLVSLEDGTVITVADDPDKAEGWGSWCRLGRKIVYTQESANSSSQLWIVDREGSNKTRLGDSRNVGVGKDWCPLGLRILYSAKDSKEKDDLWLIDLYGTNQTRLTDTPYGEWNPSFSPDGKKVVYVSDEEGKPEIWIRNIEGNYRAKLTNNIGTFLDSNPKWSPDGLKIVFTLHDLQNNTNNSNDSIVHDFNTTLIDYPNHSVFSNNSTLTDYANNSAYSNNSAIYSSNNSIINGSDIALIKLAPAFAVSPLPMISSVKFDYISEVSKDGAANISVTVKNEGRKAGEGNVSISFPDGERIKSVEGTGSSAKIYSMGDLIQGKNGEISAQYPFVELVEYGWGREQEETLNITVVPNNGTEEIVFLVRTALKNDLTGTYSSNPLYSENFDQQGVEVYIYSMNISQA
jgi:Tol biopolymer transport system component